MQFIKVDELPYFDRHGKPRRYIQSKLKEFMDMNTKYAKVVLEEGEYTSAWTAFSSIKGAVHYAEHPIIVSYRSGDVYLMRTDM